MLMKNLKFLLAIITTVVLIHACTKETSFETGKNFTSKAEGTLKDSLGNCRNIVVKGNYKVDSILRDSNYLIVQVTITASGQYLISSDTVNGFWFRDSNYVAAGTSTLKIRGYGKPILPVNTQFTLTFNNSACLFNINLSGTTTPPVITPVFRDYFPTTIGSNWGYNVAGFTDTLHVYAANKDTTISGNSYRILYGARGIIKDTAFYRKNANDYFRWDALDLNSGRMALLFLKDNQPVNTTWESTMANTIYMGLPTEVKMKYTLMNVNFTRVVNGNSFDSVIHVKNDLQYKILGTFQTIQTIHTYFAKNVGLIEFDAPGLYNQKLFRWRVY